MKLKDDELKKRIFDIVSKDTLIHTSKGYLYLLDVLFLYCKDGGVKRKLVNDIYVEVANIHNTRPMCVERSLRYAIQKSKLGKTTFGIMVNVRLMIINNIEG